MPSDLEKSTSSATVRPDWLDRVVLESQIAGGRVSFEEVDEAHATIAAFAKALPAPGSHVERLILRGLILEFACRCGEAVHARLHGKSGASCEFPPAALLQSLWVHSDDPRLALVHWADAFFEALKAQHQPTLATRAARWVRKDYTRPVDVSELADHFHVTPSRLHRAFKREFGVSIREYQRDLRSEPTVFRAQTMQYSSNDRAVRRKK